MMRLKVFSLLCCSLISTAVFSQYKISGTVKGPDSLQIRNCSVYLNDDKSETISNQKGEFLFKNIPAGKYVVLVRSVGYELATAEVAVHNSDVKIGIVLSRKVNELEEVVIKNQKTDFGFSHLRAVENLGIYEGKKSEVIIPDQLVANLATNNARQIYSRVAGLNIWENDYAGIQLSIGGRGLDPNRSSNFNTRQNGYDISADALGYPESYYTPPAEAVEQIQIVRGAASLQYGTQFGGLVNFIMKKPAQDKPFQLTVRQTGGSYGFYNTFASASGTSGKMSYYTYFQYKTGDGYRGNSDFNSYTGYANVNYQFSEKTKLSLDFTHMNYLAHQPGGLSDEMFAADPTQSNRERNWFKVAWNLYALHFDHKFDASNEVNLRVFGLSANRYTVGFRPNRVSIIDDGSKRDLIRGDFENWGLEGRFLKRYELFNKPMVFLLGTRYYHGFNHSVQGDGSTGKDADFNLVDPDHFTRSDYRFPNRNISIFTENIINITDQFSIIPGLRYEHIDTKANGFYAQIDYDLAGNVIANERKDGYRHQPRTFFIAGLGLSYKPGTTVNIYGNISQNYRSTTFSDMQIVNNSLVIDPDLSDERGYSADLGVRSEHTSFYSYDVSAFYLNYNNRIGEYYPRERTDAKLLRANIGQAVIIGVESYGEADLLRLLNPGDKDWSGVVFANTAFIKSKYRKSRSTAIEGNQVEFVPDLNLKSGLRLGYKNVKASFQYTHLSDQYSDATNAVDGGTSATLGLIPAYTVMDASISYEYKRYKLEGSVNNLANAYYYTRRATGYPGPGILPSDNRTFFLTLQFKL